MLGLVQNTKPLPDHKSKSRKHPFRCFLGQSGSSGFPNRESQTPRAPKENKNSTNGLSVGPSGFCPKRTSVLSEPVAHGPQSSLNIESSEVNRVRSGDDRVNRIDLIFD